MTRTLGVPLMRGRDSDRAFFAEAAGGGEFAPDDIAELQLWLRADAIGQADGSDVDVWQDFSSENHDFTKNVNAPTLQTNELNGLPVVRWPPETGASPEDLVDNIDLESGPGWGASQTWFFVVQSLATADAVIRVGFEYADNVNGKMALGLFLDTDYAPGWFFASDSDAAEPFDHIAALAATPTDWHILALRLVPSANARAFDDGGVPVVMGLDPSYDDAVRTAIPGPWTTTAEQLNMEYAEIISYRDALTNAEMDQVGDYLATKYALTWTDLTPEPTDLAPLSPALWLRADEIEGFVDDAVLPYWTDSSSHYRDALTEVGAEPTYQTNVLNGLPVVRFASANDAHVYAAGWTTITGASTIVAVAKAGAGTSPSVEDWSDGQPGLVLSDALDQVQLLGTSTLTAPDSTLASAFHIIVGVANGASSRIHVDGPQVASGNIGATAIGDGIAIYSEGEYAELLVFDGVLSNTDLNAVGNYLADKYALSWTDI